MLPCNVPNKPHTPLLGMEHVGETTPPVLIRSFSYRGSLLTRMTMHPKPELLARKFRLGLKGIRPCIVQPQ